MSHPPRLRYLPAVQSDLGIYVHLPFCRVRCTYCPFAISTDLSEESPYFDALAKEIELAARGEQVKTLYFGGGTPSRSSPEQLRRIVGLLRSRYDIASDAEFTLEANPEDVDPPFLELLRDLGVNRISLGVQSLNDVELTRIGRRHGSTHARGALELLRDAGIRSSADLIIGLPEQSEASLHASVAEIIASGVGHISLYMLDLEEGTKLEQQVRSGRVELPADDAVADSYLWVVETLERAGLHQYEISNFARPDEESRHNLRYWERLPYRGFGMGAHGFDGAVRRGNSRELPEYVRMIEEQGSAVVFEETLSELERTREEIFLALRQRRGIGYADLLKLRGEEGARWIESGLREGWLQSSGERVGFTANGFVLSNEYISQLF
jgi:oxygen-independent coproporphyrinogen-3 oxidase